jgi:integrase/recombinase XerD
MSPQVLAQTWSLTSYTLDTAYTDFILSRQAMNCTKSTMDFYRHTAGKFLSWIEAQGVTRPEEVSAMFVRQYFTELQNKGRSDTTVRDHARAIRTLLNFWLEEGYVPTPVKFQMPKVARKRLPVLSAEQLQQVIKACENPRDKAIVLFMADTGARREEVCNLDWGDLDMTSGLVMVKRGKGGKARSVVIGALTRRSLLKYRRTISVDATSPLFQSRTRERLTGQGLRLVYRRLAIKTGIKGLSPHAMRRTFTILSLRANMSVLTVQSLLGHEDLTMTMHYAQMVDDDLIREHRAHSPIDNLHRG